MEIGNITFTRMGNPKPLGHVGFKSRKYIPQVHIHTKGAKGYIKNQVIQRVHEGQR